MHLVLKSENVLSKSFLYLSNFPEPTPLDLNYLLRKVLTERAVAY